MAERGGRPHAQSAYRGGAGARAGGGSDDAGLAHDVVRQFADPYAFYRELVQNAIDAGATRIVVRLMHDAGEGVVLVAVEDDGSGMTEAILENDLTVLFKSTKETRDDAIGKFGIGFVSVLAIEPTLVTVDTSVGDGIRRRLDLHPDHTWDLTEEAAAGGRGTTVTLRVPRAEDAVDELIARSEASLSRWCMHARVPITLAVQGRDPVRIDRPLALPNALVEAKATSPDGRTEILVGLPAEGRGHAAFYNRGLLLFETEIPLPRLGGLSFKVVDPRLEHTLSRDDVRRDAHFAGVLEHVAKAARGPLTDAVHRASGSLAGAAWRALALAALAADLPISPSALSVPLAAPIRGASSLPLARIERLRVLPGAPEIVEALAGQGLPVLDVEAGRDGELVGALGRWAASTPRIVADGDLWVRQLAGHPLEALAEPLTRLCGAVLRAPSRLVLTSVTGEVDRLHFGVRIQATEAHYERAWLGDEDPFRWLSRPPLALVVEHPVMKAAQGALARGAPHVVVAAAIVRAILIERGAAEHLPDLGRAAQELA